MLVKRSVFGLVFLVCIKLLKNDGDRRVQDEASRVMRFTGRSSVVGDRWTDERLPPKSNKLKPPMLLVHM